MTRPPGLIEASRFAKRVDVELTTLTVSCDESDQHVYVRPARCVKAARGDSKQSRDSSAVRACTPNKPHELTSFGKAAGAAQRPQVNPPGRAALRDAADVPSVTISDLRTL